MISREILDDPMYFAERFTRMQAFEDLCYLASFQEREFSIRGNRIKLQIGQVAKSVRDLAQRWQWSVNTVTKYLKELAEDGYIDTQKTSVNQIITIKKYLLLNTQNDTRTDTQNKTQNDTPIINIEELKKEIKKEIKEELTSVSEKKEKEKVKKEKDEKFEECWLAYNRKGSKAKSLEYWNKLSDADKELVLPHIKAYVSSRERGYQKDFERYLRDKIFKNIVVKGNDTIYDPERFSSPDEYRPIADGVFLVWNDDRKCLLFNGYIDQLNDGYTPENRPDGAKVASGMYEWIWSGITKEWVKQ